MDTAGGEVLESRPYRPPSAMNSIARIDVLFIEPLGLE